MSYDENRISDLIDGGFQQMKEYEDALEVYLKEGINYNATPIGICKKEDLEQLAADSFYEGYKAALNLKHKISNTDSILCFAILD